MCSLDTVTMDLSCLNQANNSCHFNNSPCIVSLLVLKIIYVIFENKVYCIASVLKVTVNY